MTNRPIAVAGRLGALGALLCFGTACQDLTVPNLNEADRDRSLANAASVEALIGGSFFPNFFRPTQGSDGGLSGLVVSLFSYVASDFTSTLGSPATSAVWYLDLTEPRPPLENAPSICSTICQHGPRDYWGRIQKVPSLANDGLQVLEGGLVLRQGNVDVTPRARAFAKFMQGWAWGYTAIVFDRANVVPETVDLNTVDIQALNHSSLIDYDETMEAAIEAIEEAIAIARQYPDVVNFPSAAQSTLWFGSPNPISNAQFIQIAHTVAARLLVLNARSPQDRANVNWARVLQFTAGGISSDANNLEFALSTTRPSTLLDRVQGNTATGLGNGRWDYRTIGMADQSGAYQTWISSAPADRTRFNIVTPDRRITGTTPTSNGTYTRYQPGATGLLPARGEYLLSNYQWARHMLRFGLPDATRHTAGNQLLVSADENRLLRAEALLRTAGPTQEVVDLINVTRTRPQTIAGTQHPGLPPLTTAGVPEVNGVCVPRTDSGACGTVMTALRYERMVELAGMDALRGYADSRGFGMLPDGSLKSYPVPGNVLNLYGMAIYTYGGVGGPESATYNPTN
jgi:hypothetical protein